MKRLLLIMMLLTSFEVNAQQWVQNGVWVSNVCRNEKFITYWPLWWALPIGSFCRLSDGTGGYAGDEVRKLYYMTK